MTRRERLMATLKGLPVDRPAVNFYELNGLDQNPSNPDPFNIYSDPSWAPLIDLTREKSDRIVMRVPQFVYPKQPLDERCHVNEFTDEKGALHRITEINADGRILRSHTRREKDQDTTWSLEHLLKDEADLQAWLDLPSRESGIGDFSGILETEAALGETGIVMIDYSDALGIVAGMFSMEDYTVLALTEPELMRRALDRVQERLLREAEDVAGNLPGRLWRIVGPEYAAPPYLPPRLYEEYVTRYDKELVEIIHRHGGYARIHQHGRSKDILDLTLQTGCMAIDPIEPPPQGDVTLDYVRKRYGDRLVLFGNLEINDIELLPTAEFEKKVYTALEEGVGGKGFVLMPSSCPFGRKLPDLTRDNYFKIIEVVEQYFGC